MIGFDRSALVANPTCGIGNQNVNRVVTVRFMTKVFGASYQKFEPDKLYAARRNNYESG
jgi:hypothetical protein